MRVLAVVVPCSLLAITSVTAQERPSDARILGHVMSREVPLAGVEISIIGTSTTVFTDSAGQFRLTGLTPGLTVLRVRRIGYNGEYLRTTLDSGRTQEVEIEMQAGAYRLPEVEVNARSAKPIEFAWTTKYDDFFRRRWQGFPGGTFISGDDIKRRAVIHTAELLEQYVPGARVILHFVGDGGTEINFPRCSRAVGYVGVYVDGRKINWQSQYQQAYPIDTRPEAGRSLSIGTNRRNATELADVLDDIKPDQIQFMEVYRGIGSIPGEFSGGCGAIVIWTK